MKLFIFTIIVLCFENVYYIVVRVLFVCRCMSRSADRGGNGASAGAAAQLFAVSVLDRYASTALQAAMVPLLDPFTSFSYLTESWRVTRGD